jgi:hypothetical protein
MFHNRVEGKTAKEIAQELNIKRKKMEEEEARMKQLGLRKLSKYEEMLGNDPMNISQYNVFQSNISY